MFNRSRAWRTDGGTAAFGLAALLLGLIGAVLNFIQVAETRLRWLEGLVNCLLLWQCWLSFWWFAGAGMHNGEAGEISKREQKKMRTREGRRNSRRDAARNHEGSHRGGGGNSLGGSIRRRITSLTSRNRGGSSPSPGEGEPGEEDIELVPLPSSSAPATPTTFPTESQRSTLSATPSNFLARLFSPFLQRLIRDHERATITLAASNQLIDSRFSLRSIGNRFTRERNALNPDHSFIHPGAQTHREAFIVEGGERFDQAGEGEEEQEWEDEIGVPAIATTSTRDSNDVTSWRSAVSRWRVRDVSHY